MRVSDPAEPHSVDGAAFARLMAPFGPFEARPELAVAVSGGRDSLSLVLLAQEWACGRGGRVLALIVDHGLRTGAARLCATFGRRLYLRSAKRCGGTWRAQPESFTRMMRLLPLAACLALAALPLAALTAQQETPVAPATEAEAPEQAA